MSEYLLAILAWRGVTGEKDLLVNAVERWRDSAHLAFVDAYLAALAAKEQCPMYTKNVADMEGQGGLVPNPLPERSV